MQIIIAMMSLQSLQKRLLSEFQFQGLITVSDIAKHCNVEQSSVHRNLIGKPKRITSTLKKLCNYANIDWRQSLNDPASNKDLMRALSLVWDGSDAHAKKIAQLIILANSL